MFQCLDHICSLLGLFLMDCTHLPYYPLRIAFDITMFPFYTSLIPPTPNTYSIHHRLCRGVHLIEDRSDKTITLSHKVSWKESHMRLLYFLSLTSIPGFCYGYSEIHVSDSGDDSRLVNLRIGLIADTYLNLSTHSEDFPEEFLYGPALSLFLEEMPGSFQGYNVR